MMIIIETSNNEYIHVKHVEQEYSYHEHLKWSIKRHKVQDWSIQIHEIIALSAHRQEQLIRGWSISSCKRFSSYP